MDRHLDDALTTLNNNSGQNRKWKTENILAPPLIFFLVILFVFVIVFGLAHINQASLLLLLAGVLNASCVDENSCHFSIKSLTGPLNRGVIWTADKRDLPTFGSGRFHGFQELGDIYFF